MSVAPPAGPLSDGLPLTRPHHDGSDLYVSTPSPALGETVTLWVRAPTGSAQRVWVRWVQDGEPWFREARTDRRDEAETWWRVDLEVANPVTPYRFLLWDGERPRWLTGEGVVPWDVPDTTDFRLVTFDPPPAWVADAVFYQVVPDRFASSEAARTWPSWARPARWEDPVKRGGLAAMTQLYGGDLLGIEERVGHLEDLGVNALYLTPFFPAESNHRYNASTFDRVDPFLGGDEALARLVRSLHARGIRVVGDLTLNHCGSTHEWFLRAQTDPHSVEATFFHRRKEEWEYWLGVVTLPKFDHRSPELRRRLYEGPDSVAARWLRPPFDLDGWRIDVANMTGRFGEVDLTREVARTVRRTVRQVKPDAYLLAEHAHDASADLLGDGWDGTMNYAGFTRPLWCWLAGPEAAGVDFLGTPAGVPRLPGWVAARTIDLFRSAVPWRSWVHSLILLGSHDTARWRTVTGDRGRALVGFGVLLTFPGVPCLLYGDEVGLEGVDNEDARRPMPWDPGSWDLATYEVVRGLVRLRRERPALRHGGFRWVHVGEDALAYLRESRGERLLVLAARAPHEPVRVPAPALGLRDEAEHLTGGPALRPGRDGTVTLPSDGPALHVWELP